MISSPLTSDHLPPDRLLPLPVLAGPGGGGAAPAYMMPMDPFYGSGQQGASMQDQVMLWGTGGGV